MQTCRESTIPEIDEKEKQITPKTQLYTHSII